MGLLDFTSKVLTEYKADVSQHKAAIKSLTGEQKALAKAELEAAEARNKQLEDGKDRLGKFALAVGGVFAAIKVGQAGLDEYIKYSQLSAVTNSETLERLKTASGGLRSEMDLLTFAAKSNHASFKLTTEQQELALKAMRALEKQGFDSAQVFDKVTQSLVTLQGDGLKEFGIQVEQGKTKADAFKNIMSALAGEVAKAGGSLDAQGDDAKRLGVQWEDALSTIKRAIGAVVAGLGPLISAVTDVASAVGAVVEKASKLASYVPGGSSALAGAGAAAYLGGPGGLLAYGAYRGLSAVDGSAPRSAVQGGFDAATGRTLGSALVFGASAGAISGRDRNGVSDLSRALGGGGYLYGDSATQVEQSGLAMNQRFIDANQTMLDAKAKALGQDKIAKDVNDILDQSNRDVQRAIKKQAAFDSFVGDLTGGIKGYLSPKKKPGSGGGKAPTWDLRTDYAAAYEPLGPDRQGDLNNSVGASVGGNGLSAFGDQIFGENMALQGAINDKSKSMQAADDRRQSALAKVFGPLSDFNAYASGFELLKGAVTSAFQAWMDGSKSIGQAVKGAISAMIGAKAVDMLAESLRHGAYAIGSLAFGDVRGAALHGTAAVKFAAGAVGLGVLAKGLGGGGGTSSSAGGPSSAAPLGQSALPAPAAARPITILIGDEMATASPRRLQQRAAAQLELAKRGMGSDSGVQYG